MWSGVIIRSGIMNDINKMFEEAGGIMKTAVMLEKGITHFEISKYMDAGMIERIKKGYYILSDYEISDIGIVASIVPEGVICLYSALFHYGYSDRTPAYIHIAVDKDISKARVAFDYPFVKPYFVEPQLLTMGVEETEIDGVVIKIQSRDRLICDCLKFEKRMDAEIFNKAILNYIRDSKKNISKLMEYAKVRNVEKKVYGRIGVWL